jgi:hypothetical protein
VVISANTPLGAQAMLAKECRKMGIGFVFWLPARADRDD